MILWVKVNFPHFHLGFLFGISESTSGRIFRRNIVMLARIFKPLLQSIPPPYFCKQIQPKCFSSNSLTKDCTLAIDCTDVFFETTRKDLNLACSSYSEYRKGNTGKALVAILPSGCITFVSSLFPGRISDKDICLKSGFYDTLVPGHRILADKGFKIFDDLPPGVTVAMPAWKQKDKQFGTHEALSSRVISSARSHVERVNERIKNYHILDLINHDYNDIASSIFFVICALVNVQNPIMSEVNDALNECKC